MSHETDNATRVIVTDIHMPFWSMVRFMVKWAFAAIPALIILGVLGALLSALLGGLVQTVQERRTVSADDVSPPVQMRLV
jgi:hypothetical protein